MRCTVTTAILKAAVNNNQRPAMPQRKIEFRPATKQEEEAVLAGLNKHTSEAGGVVHDKDKESFSVLVYEAKELIAAVIGKVFWSWLYIDLVWVSENHRKTGLGTKVMTIAEEKAKEMGLTGIYLWTETWQAPDFYPKFGYETFVIFDDFPPGHKRYGYRKYL